MNEKRSLELTLSATGIQGSTGLTNCDVCTWGGADEGDSEAKDEVKLGRAERFLMAGWTSSAVPAGGGIGERTGSGGISARGEKLESGITSLPIPNRS